MLQDKLALSFCSYHGNRALKPTAIGLEVGQSNEVSEILVLRKR